VKRVSIYEDLNRLTPRREEDEDEDGEWVKLAEQDMATGRWTWQGRYKPFRQTPLGQWRPR
jgi:hypothetical protein